MHAHYMVPLFMFNFFFSLLCRLEMQSGFQRSFSRVWFSSQQQQPHSIYDNFNSLPTYYNATHQNPLQSIIEQEESFTSPKNESGDERKRSFLIWGNRQSPSSQSHKSQVL